jgi:hypothetical protein
MQHSEQPYIELGRAVAAVDAMRNAKTLEEFEENWKELLRRTERTWNKIHAHFGKSPKWSSWHIKFESLRKTDQVLSYLVNARGAEEHTVNEIVGREPGGIGINAAEGNSLYIERMEITGGKITIQSSQKLKIDFISARTTLMPVLNRGRTYQVPTEHLGKPIDSKNVVAVAEAGIAFYRSALQEAEFFFVK